MKSKFSLLAVLGAAVIFTAKAQNTFPANGNVGIGTLTPAASLQVIGKSLTGSAANYTQIDVNGNLRLFGSANYKVAGNHYAFQYVNNPNYGLFFNSAKSQFEFLDGVQRPVFSVNADNGQGFFRSGVEIGNSQDNFSGNIRWTGNDFEGYNGAEWKSFTYYAPAGANMALSNLSSTAVNTNFLPDLDNTRDLGYTTKSWRNIYIDGAYYLQGYKFINSKDQNVLVGRSAGANISTGANNTFTGSQSGVQTTSGSDNTFLGYSAGNKNTTGKSNTFTGSQSGVQTTTGSDNTFIGYSAGNKNTTGKLNTLIGSNAAVNLISSSNSTYIGASSGSGTGTGSFNTFMGYQSGNILSSHNTGIGIASGFLNTGDNNIFVGEESGYYNQGDKNVFIGNYSGKTSTTGSENVFIGYESGKVNFGSSNTFIGNESGTSNLEGYGNTYVGESAGHNNQQGTGNTCLGNFAGYYNNGDDYTTFIGYNSGGSGVYTNATAIGYDAQVTASNQVRIGNSNVTSIGGFAGWTNVSDSRFKKNIKENIPGLQFINKLRPVSYNLDNAKIQSYLGKNDSTSQNKAAVAAMEKILHTGFIAQEVEKAAKELNYDFDGVDIPKSEKDYYGIRYAEFVVPLVKAVQELSRENDVLKETVNSQQKINNVLQKQIDELKAMMSGTVKQTSSSNPQSVTLSAPKTSIQRALEQNAPNPFRSSTVIKYHLPSAFSMAQLLIADGNGNTIKVITLPAKEDGQINIAAGVLAQGTYFYSLIVDGMKIDAKQMQIVR